MLSEFAASPGEVLLYAPSVNIANDVTSHHAALCSVSCECRAFKFTTNVVADIAPSSKKVYR